MQLFCFVNLVTLVQQNTINSKETKYNFYQKNIKFFVVLTYTIVIKMFLMLKRKLVLASHRKDMI